MLTDTIFFFFSCNTPSLIDNLTQQLRLISTGQLATDLLQFNLSAHNKTILHIERKIKTLHLKFLFHLSGVDDSYPNYKNLHREHLGMLKSTVL